MSEIIKTKLFGVTQENFEDHSRQQIIKKMVKTDEILLLEREPNNTNDPNAIAAYVAPDDDPWDQGEYQVGYLKSELASRLAPIIDAGGRVTCVVLDVTGGSEGDNYGVNVALGVFSPEEVAEYDKTKKVSFLTTLPINGQKRSPTEDIQPLPKKTTYKISKWRAIIGIFSLVISFSLLVAGIDSWGMLIAFLIFLVPTVILLLPWERWLFDQIKKMFARKHLG